MYDKIIDEIENNYSCEVIEFSPSEIIVSKYGFEYEMIEDLCEKFDLDIHFEYKIDDDVEVVEILI